MKQIVKYPNKILRVVTKNIEKIDKELISEIEELSEILDKCENGAGLAAVQIGLDKRFFGIKDTKTQKTKIYINPEITKTFEELEYTKIINDKDKEDDFLEGCLSFPDFFGTVKRFLKIQVTWEEVEGDKLIKNESELIGFDAIVFQHELDHLNGIVFVDHVKEEGGKFYKQLEKGMAKWNVKMVLEPFV